MKKIIENVENKAEESVFSPIWLSNEEGIIKPESFKRNIGVENAVMCFQSKTYSKLLDNFEKQQGSSRNAPEIFGACRGKIFRKTAVFMAFTGASNVANFLEALIASGVKKILMIGWAGSVSPECKIGDIVVPVWGVREEGASYHYLVPEIMPRPSENLLKIIRKSVFNGAKCVEGGVWTTDAIFRETPEKIKKYAQDGVLAVEMECATAMSVAICRNIDFAAILLISDEVSGDKWSQGFRTDEARKAENVAVRVAAKIFSES